MVLYPFAPKNGGFLRAIKTTPAMEAGVTDFLWSMEDIVMMTEMNA